MAPADEAADAGDVGSMGTGGTAVVLALMFAAVLVPIGVGFVAGASWVFQTLGVFGTASLFGPTVLAALLWVPGAAVVFSFGGTVLGKVVRDDTDPDDQADADDVPEDTGDDPAETIAAIRETAGSDGAPARPRADMLRALIPPVTLVVPATLLTVTGTGVAWYWWVFAGVGSLSAAITATGMGPFVGGTGGPWPPGWVVALNYGLGLPLAVLSVGWSAELLGWVQVPETITVAASTTPLTADLAVAPPLVFAVTYTVLAGAPD